MEHSEAVRVGAVDRYLLGELNEDEREGFEEHFFSCVDCGQEIAAGAAFVDGARQVLRTTSSASADERPAVRSRPAGPRLIERLAAAFWPMPLGAAATLVVALGGLGWQRLVTVPGLRGELLRSENPQPTTREFLSVSRAPERRIVRRSPGKRWASLTLSKSTERTLTRYAWEVLDSSGGSLFPPVAGEPDPDGEVHLLLPIARMPSGDYVLVLRGVTVAGGDASEIARYQFSLQD